MMFRDTVVRGLRSTLPRSVKDRIFGLGFHLAPDRFGEYAHLYARAPDMHRGLARLKARGARVDEIVDVGAFEGKFCRMTRAIWADASIHMVEANVEKKAGLERVAEDCDATLSMALLGARDGESVEFFVMSSGSSVLEENSPLARRKVAMKTACLDTVIASRSVDLLKLDVQGYELEVLRGASGILANVGMVLLEVSLLEINRGCPLLAEVVAFMAERGLIVSDVLGIHRRPLDGATNQIDLLFQRADSNLMTDTRHFV